MDIWKIEKPFDYKIFFSNLTPHAVCYLVIRHSGKYCSHHQYYRALFQDIISVLWVTFSGIIWEYNFCSKVPAQMVRKNQGMRLVIGWLLNELLRLYYKSVQLPTAL